jgi:type II secretory pathway component PulF
MKNRNISILLVVIILILTLLIPIKITMFDHLEPENVPLGLAIFLYIIFIIGDDRFIAFITFIVIIILLKILIKYIKNKEWKK